MNIETVNELIQSLESAGELSIRETKIMALARAYQQLAAENVALKVERVRIFNSGYQRGHEATVEGYYVDIHQNDITTYHEDIVAEIAEEQTPATDRIVAGIKADGVEMFALMFAEEAIKDNNITTGWKARASRAASEYAELLREGADK